MSTLAGILILSSGFLTIGAGAAVALWLALGIAEGNKKGDR